ncbi:MAG: hypothetical protein ABI197_07300 [Granulicella sp.]
MATKVSYELPVGNVENIALRITRRSGSSKHGELAIWQNEIGFKPSNHETFYVVSWTELADFIVEKGKRGKKKAAAVKHEV